MSQLGRTTGRFPSLEACIVPPGTMRTSPQVLREEVFWSDPALPCGSMDFGELS